MRGLKKGKKKVTGKNQNLTFSVGFIPIKMKCWYEALAARCDSKPCIQKQVFCGLPREAERREDSPRALSLVTVPHKMSRIGPRVPEQSACSKRKDEMVKIQL